MNDFTQIGRETVYPFRILMRHTHVDEPPYRLTPSEARTIADNLNEHADLADAAMLLHNAVAQDSSAASTTLAQASASLSAS